MATISDVSDEILIRIFYYIDFVQRQRLEIVCKKWRYINRRMWRNKQKLHFTLDHPKQFESHFENYQDGIHLTSNKIGNFEGILSKFDGNLIKLNIDDKHWNSRHKTPDAISDSIKRNRDLTSIRIAIRNNDVRRNLLEYLPTDKLQHLSIDNLGGSGPLLDYTIETALKKSRQLTFLHVSFVSSTSSVLEIISKMETLKALYIGDIQGSLTHISAKKWSDLEVLSIESGKLINDTFLCEIAENCKKLRVLNLKNCKYIKRRGIEAIGRLENLRYLNLDKISLDLRFLEFISNLDEFYCNIISRSTGAILSFLQRSPNLKRCYLLENHSKQNSHQYLQEETKDWFEYIVKEADATVEWRRPETLHVIHWEKIFHTVN